MDAEREGEGVQLDAATRAKAARLAAEIAEVAQRGLALPGSLLERHTRCGRSGCRCGAEPALPHGPYWSWTRKVQGKTRTRYLSTEQHADYEAWFDTAKRLRELLAELETLGLEVIEADPRWQR